MDKIKTSHDIDHRRRHFIGAAALAVAAAQLGTIGAVDAQPAKANCPRSSRDRTLRSVR
jgi:nitrous oxide reductase